MFIMHFIQNTSVILPFFTDIITDLCVILNIRFSRLNQTNWLAVYYVEISNIRPISFGISSTRKISWYFILVILCSNKICILLSYKINLKNVRNT